MRSLTILIAFCTISIIVIGQDNLKKSFSHKDYNLWQTIDKQMISNHGKYISYEINPQKGDGVLKFEIPGGKHITIPRGKENVFGPKSDFAAFKIRQPEDSIIKAKLAKTKPEKMPKDSLGILIFKTDSLIKVPDVKSFKVAEEKSNWMVYLLEEKEQKPDTTLKNDSTIQKKPEKKNGKTDKKKNKGTEMIIINPITNYSQVVNHVTDYTISKNGALIAWISQVPGEKCDTTVVSCFETENRTQYQIFQDTGSVKGIVTDQQGEQIAFIQSSDTNQTKKYRLYYSGKPGKKARLLIDTIYSSLPNGWCVSEHTVLKFSDSGNRLFFEISPKPLPEIKDTIPEEDQARLDIWSWKDPLLQSQQIKQLKDEEKRNYLCLFDLSREQVIQLAGIEIPRVIAGKTGDNRYFYGLSELPYQKLKSWDKTYSDIYIIDTKTGESKKIIEKHASSVTISPSGEYLVWYNLNDSSWYSYSIQENSKKQISNNLITKFYDEENDVPDTPNNYGIAGFVDKNESILVYDRFDIWQIDLNGVKESLNLTKGITGDKKNRYRYVKLDKDEEWINLTRPILLKSFNLISKEAGFYSLDVSQERQLKELISGDFQFSNPIKAKDSDEMIWTKGNFRILPELHLSKTDFSENVKLTSLGKQMEQFKWGNVELVSWNSFDGNKMDGLLYTPENMDSTKKYPMIVYFYEKYSDDLYRFYNPSPSRSTVNFSVYTSNDYIVFVPDITYRTGMPGKSAYDDIISGTLEMCKRQYINMDKMGIQGQSWGGYQVAWLVTQTKLFKAGMAGAPVSNMTSAYGGIRWESGMSRMFQYEKSQSRIGATLWENTLSYLENSPVFYADRVETPLLIMHNDADGAVPWYQGIEYFTALRRLGKPSWLLVYNGEEHNLTKWHNRVDLSIRMMQFFDHYLKDQPEPVWMKEGIPAIQKGRLSGFEITR